ncbi:MAG: thiamine pyrophosphate-binding protein [Betaproteobacteria bacterium]|nr:thiamine pyrophosphate-binding protein [Betaproteobacteria bacterium]MBV9359925.1 thiamine pyrophosphate-binding protein [Betaproteobacteria bacterium]
MARKDRRRFLTGVLATGAATAVAPAVKAQEKETERAPTALPPTTQVAALETENPGEMAENRIKGTAGSDFMVDVIKTLNIKYCPANCASSYRGIHESLINYGGNKMPEFLTCMHEESAVAMGHGYFKVAGKPLMTLCHGTVGLQHATMGIYNAWCDRVPVIVIGGNDLDAAHRPPGVPTFHSAQDIGAMVRDYTKWDDTPISLQHFAQSMVRAYKIAMTPPYGPVLISLDAGLQQEVIKEHGSEKLYIPKYVPTSPPQGDSGAVKEAARMLAAADNPVIVADRAARTPNGIKLLVQLAELLQARVIDQGSRVNFPKTHYLSTGPAAVSGADVIIGLELSDFWNTVNNWTDNGENGVGENSSRIKPGTKLISISASELLTKSNFQDFQRFQAVDISMVGDAEATLPALIEAVRSAIPNSRKDAIAQRGQAARKAFADQEARAKQAATLGWDASPISTARLVMETYNAVKGLDWSIVSQSGNTSNWQNRLWPLTEHHHWIGRSGGFGVGYGAPASVGAALANKDAGRISVNIQADGDLMYAPGVLWTAAKHKIPQLAVMHNNRGYHQEVMHVQRMASFRNRKSNYGGDMGPVGTRIENPDIEYHKLAESMGWWAKGPIKDPAQLAPALREAVKVVQSGTPALLNVWTQPR